LRKLPISTKEKCGGHFVLLMALSPKVQFVSARNNCEIDTLNIEVLLCEMLSLAQENFNLDTFSKFILE